MSILWERQGKFGFANTDFKINKISHHKWIQSQYRFER